MRSATESNTSVQNVEDHREDSVRVIMQRLLFILGTSAFCWAVLGVIIYTTSFPAMTPVQEGQIPPGPELLSIRVAAGILISHFVSVLAVQILAPRAVIRSRLISNTMLGGLLTCFCAVFSVIGQLVPSDAVPYMKQALSIAYYPPFVIANFIAGIVVGLMIYIYRETRPADQSEIYWCLGLMFLYGLSIALVMAIAGA